MEGQAQSAPKTIGTLSKMFCIFSSKSGDSSWNMWWVIARTSKSWHTHRYTHTDTGDDNTRRPKGPWVKTLQKWAGCLETEPPRSQAVKTLRGPIHHSQIIEWLLILDSWQRKNVLHHDSLKPYVVVPQPKNFKRQFLRITRSPGLNSFMTYYCMGG